MLQMGGFGFRYKLLKLPPNSRSITGNGERGEESTVYLDSYKTKFGSRARASEPASNKAGTYSRNFGKRFYVWGTAFLILGHIT